MITPMSLPCSLAATRRLLAQASLCTIGLILTLLSGCSSTTSPISTPAATTSSNTNQSTSTTSNSTTTTTTIPAATPVVTAKSFAAVTGNWKLSFPGTRLKALSGSLVVDGASVTGVLHPISSSCAADTNVIPVVGTIASTSTADTLTLSSTTAFENGAVAVTGTIAADGRSLSDPTLAVTGGSCVAAPAVTGAALPRGAAANVAQQYQPISGTYAGSFSDPDGQVLPLTATLTQTSSADANGTFHLTGNATFANNPCINTPVVTDSTVTGDTLSATYTDANTGNSVTASGTFSIDAATLTITNWTISGSCGRDAGTGVLTRQ